MANYVLKIRDKTIGKPVNRHRNKREVERLRTKWLKLLERGATNAEATSICGVSRNYFRQALTDNPKFRERYVRAKEIAKEARADALRKESYRRSVKGVKKTVYYKGQKVGTERQYSDTLLSQELKAHCDEFKETRNEASSANNYTGAAEQLATAILALLAHQASGDDAKVINGSASDGSPLQLEVLGKGEPTDAAR